MKACCIVVSTTLVVHIPCVSSIVIIKFYVLLLIENHCEVIVFLFTILINLVKFFKNMTPVKQH